MNQLVKYQTLDFGSGHVLRVPGVEPCVGLCADSAETGILSLFPLSLYPSLKINKHLKKREKILIQIILTLVIE